MNASDIINNSDKRSQLRATHQHLVAKLYKVIDNKVLYTVTSSSRHQNYLVTIQLLDLASNKLKSLQSALDGNLKISCTCDAFLFQGYKYIAYKKGVGIDKETRSPDKTNPEKKGLACKHIIVALNQMKADFKLIYNLFKSNTQLPTSNDKALDIKSNSSSDVPTEIDLSIIDQFKSACLSLYREYDNYSKDTTPNKPSFTDSQYYSKVDPITLLSSLSQPTSKLVAKTNIGKLKSVNDIISMIDRKHNGFNILLNSDVSFIIKRINASINLTTESLINNIILNLIKD